MILKEYQKRARKMVDEFLQRRAEWRGTQAEFLQTHPDRTINSVRYVQHWRIGRQEQPGQSTDAAQEPETSENR